MAPAFLRFALLSPVLRKQYDRVRFGNAVQRLNVEHVRQLALPLPPLPEQKEMLRVVAEALAASPIAAVSTLRRSLASLDKGVLAKAFRGELVIQDASDESADAMLARLVPIPLSRTGRVP